MLTKGPCSWRICLTVAKKQMPGEKCKNRASIFSQNSLPASNTLCRRHFLSQRLSVLFNSCISTSPPWTCPVFSWTDVNIKHPQHPMARVQGLNKWQAINYFNLLWIHNLLASYDTPRSNWQIFSPLHPLSCLWFSDLCRICHTLPQLSVLQAEAPQPTMWCYMQKPSLNLFQLWCIPFTDGTQHTWDEAKSGRGT